MKTFNIFFKGIKTISRSWSYFFVLVFFPILLILSSSLMLNSINTKNVQVYYCPHFSNLTGQPILGLNNSVALSSFLSSLPISDIDYCTYKVRSSSAGACITLTNSSGSLDVTVFYDGTNKYAEQYVKQYVLKKISENQKKVLKSTKEQVVTHTTTYLKFFNEAKEKLEESKSDLISQRADLQEKQIQLAKTNKQFLAIYYPIKESEPEFRALQKSYTENGNKLNNEILLLQNSTSYMKKAIQDLNDSNLSSSQRMDVLLLSSYFNQIQSFTNSYTQSYGSADFSSVLNNISLVYDNLDNIKETLNQTLLSLNVAIVNINSSINKIEKYLEEINGYSNSLQSFSNSVPSENLSWKFLSSFGSNDPTLIAFPLLVSIIIMFSSVVLPNMITSRQIHEKSYLREAIAPVKKRTFLFSNYLVNLFFVLIQAVILFSIGFFIVGLPLEIAGVYFLGIFLCASIFIFVGMSIGYIIDSKSLSSLITIFVVMFSMIISSVVAQPVLVSPFVRFVMSLNPFVIMYNFLKQIFLLNASFFNVSHFLFGLSFYFVVLSFVLIISKSIFDKRIRK